MGSSMLETARDLVRRAARQLGYNDQVIENFLEPDKEHEFTVKAGGKEYRAFRVQHSNKLGPYKGGIRFHPGVSVDEVRALATLMSLKTAAVGLPLGGGKGGVVVDPREISEEELEQIARDYSRQLAPHIGSSKDIPAPDVNTDSRVMDWMVDELEKVHGHEDPGGFTGKSIERGGSLGRTEATGYGASIVLGEYLRRHKMNGRKMTLALQGFGNAGYYFAEKLRKDFPNIKLIAISNSKNTWVNTEGFDVTKTTGTATKPRPEDLTDAASAEVLPSDAIFSASADILVLAALENALTAENAGEVRAKIIVELANGPVSQAAAETLNGNGVEILPDIITNAGGVVVSCLEWEQNIKKERWDAEKVLAKMSDLLTKAMSKTMDTAEKNKTSLKQAAFETALKRLLGKKG